MRRLQTIFCMVFFIFSLRFGFGEEFNEAGGRPFPLFISLGSHCEVANFIGYYGLRTAAYPFDWMLTLHESLIAVLEQDFAYFVDERFLVPHRFGVVNSYYNIDFRHDWPDFGQSWYKMDFRRILPEVQDKYQRRIGRFYDLTEHVGKVFFIRIPLDIDYSLDQYPTFTSASKRITSTEALTIRNLLLERFPNLDFDLVVINYVEEGAPDIVGLDRVYEFKVSLTHKFEDWEEILRYLQNDSS